MAERARRKSSILKLPKTRAPLQDVNSLDVKSSQEDDLTSQTTHFRRRVSFHNKNFIKEFCAEADIASVHHAPEYEQEWHASSESSGLVPSDSSCNTHSSTTISENNSTIQTRTQTSVYKSVSIHDNYDPCEETMMESKGIKASQSQPQRAQPPNPNRKNRLSFGEIRIPSNPEEESATDPVSEDAAVKSKHAETTSVQTVIETKTTETVTIQSVRVESQSSSLVHSIQFSSEVCSQTELESGKTSELHSACNASVEVSSQACQVGENSTNLTTSFPNICSEFSPSAVDVVTPSVENDVFIPPPSHHAADKTVFDDSGMDFTKPINGIIECGFQMCLEDENASPRLFEENCVVMGLSQVNDGRPADCNEVIESAGIQADAAVKARSANVTQCSNKSVDFITAIPGVIYSGCVENINNDDNVRPSISGSIDQEPVTGIPKVYHHPRNGVSQAAVDKSGRVKEMTFNRTNAMSTSMEFTQALPYAIVTHCDVGQDAENDLQEQEIHEAHSKTQKMCTSMEFTQVLPTNIHMDIADKQDAAVEQERIVCNRTQAMCTLMEFTTPVPANIQVYFEDDASGVKVGGVANQENVMCNDAQVLCTSKEFTKPLPSNILVGLHHTLGIDDKESMIYHEGNNLMDTSDGERENSHCNMEESADEDRVEHVFPSNKTYAVSFESSVGSKGAPPSVEPLEELTRNVNDALNQNEMGVKTMMPKHPLRGSIGNSVLSTDTSLVAKNGLKTICSEKATSKMVMMNVSKDSRSGRSAHSNSSASDSGEVMESFSHASNPFRSKPCLILSPPTQNGIEGVLSQSNTKQPSASCQVLISSDQDANILKRATEAVDPLMPENQTPSRKSSTPDPFKSIPCLVLSPPTDTKIKGVGCIGGAIISFDSDGVNENAKSSQNSIKEDSLIVNGDLHILKPVSSEEKETSSQKGCTTPDPFKAMPRLVTSPNMQSENEGGAHTGSNNFAVVGDRSLFYGQCGMLLDEPPPFQDVPSIDMLEISVSVNDSGAHMLHSTIRNAEIALRQIQSPGFANGDTHCSGIGIVPEEMDCKAIDEQNTTVSSNQKDQFTGPDARLLAVCNESTREGEVSLKMDVKKPSKRYVKKPSKRSRDLSLDNGNTECEMSDEINSSKRVCKSVVDTPSSVRSPKTPIVIDLHLDISDAKLSDNSLANCSNTSSSAELSVDLDLDGFVLKNQMKYPQYWKAVKEGGDLWTFKFNNLCLELTVHLKPSLQADEAVEGFNGQFISLVTESTKPIIRWAMDILMDQLNTEEWKSLLRHSFNFFCTMQKLEKLVALIRRFAVETIIQEGMLNLNLTHNSLSFNIVSFKCHLWFRVTLKLDFWENYTPDHVTVENIIGETRESEVKNLVTGVKKDLYFLRNYARDIKDYVKTLEGCCK